MENILGKIKEFFSKLSPKILRRAIIIAIAVVLIIAIGAAVISKAKYEVLYSGLDVNEAGEVYTKLQEMGVDVVIDDSNNILVDKGQADNARMTLASQGYPKSGFSYDMYSDNVTIGMSSAEKSEYLRFQLQDRLQKTIMTLDGIEEAIVTISVPDNDLFTLREDKPPVTASVVIKEVVGKQIQLSEVEAIRNLVMSSVSGLTKENVTIIDNDMNLLGSTSEEGTGGMDQRFELENIVQTKYEKEILNMTEPMFGQGNIRVAVNVNLDFDVVATQKEIFEPVVDESGIPRSTETSKETDDSVDTIKATEEIENKKDTAKTQEAVVYEINKTTQTLQQAQGAIKDMSIAIIVNQDAITPEVENSVKQLAAFTVGATPEKVTVHATPFVAKEETTTPEQTPAPWYSMFTSPILWVGIALFFAAVAGAIFGVRRVIKRRRQAQTEQEAAEMEAKRQAELETVDTTPTAEQNYKKEVENYIEAKPEEVARLMKQMIHEDDPQG